MKNEQTHRRSYRDLQVFIMSFLLAFLSKKKQQSIICWSLMGEALEREVAEASAVGKYVRAGASNQGNHSSKN